MGGLFCRRRHYLAQAPQARLGAGMAELEYLTIAEAAERLGVAPDTVRRRLKRGELAGEKEQTAQGYVWRVALPKASREPQEPAGDAGAGVALAQLRERVAGLEQLADELRSERDAWREQAARDGDAARELRILLRQAQTLALPAETASQNAPGAPEAGLQDSGHLEHRASPAKAPIARWRSFWAWLRGSA